MALIKYVCGFIIYDNEVLLMEKKRPAAQIGFLNGIGGRVEDGETPLQAMARECFEETNVKDLKWNSFLTLGQKGAAIYMMRAFAEERPDFKTMTDERVDLYPLGDILRDPKLYPDLKWILPLAMQRDYNFVNPAKVKHYEEPSGVDRLVSELIRYHIIEAQASPKGTLLLSVPAGEIFEDPDERSSVVLTYSGIQHLHKLWKSYGKPGILLWIIYETRALLKADYLAVLKKRDLISEDVSKIIQEARTQLSYNQALKDRSKPAPMALNAKQKEALAIIRGGNIAPDPRERNIQKKRKPKRKKR